MTKKETAKIMTLMGIAYPQYYRNMRKEEAEAVIDLWAEMFADDSLESVTIAIKGFIEGDEKGFPPQIGAVKAMLRKANIPKDGTPHPDGGVWFNGKQMFGIAPWNP